MQCIHLNLTLYLTVMIKENFLNILGFCLFDLYIKDAVFKTFLSWVPIFLFLLGHTKMTTIWYVLPNPSLNTLAIQTLLQTKTLDKTQVKTLYSSASVSNSSTSLALHEYESLCLSFFRLLYHVGVFSYFIFLPLPLSSYAFNSFHDLGVFPHKVKVTDISILIRYQQKIKKNKYKIPQGHTPSYKLHDASHTWHLSVFLSHSCAHKNIPMPSWTQTKPTFPPCPHEKAVHNLLSYSPWHRFFIYFIFIFLHAAASFL